jgi:hypothetical protein
VSKPGLRIDVPSVLLRSERSGDCLLSVEDIIGLEHTLWKDRIRFEGVPFVDPVDALLSFR